MSNDTVNCMIDASSLKPDDKASLKDVLRVVSGGGTMREAREASGLSAGQAAKMLGLKVDNLRRVEAGEIKPTPMLRVMMLALYDVEGFTDA